MPPKSRYYKEHCEKHQYGEEQTYVINDCPFNGNVLRKDNMVRLRFINGEDFNVVGFFDKNNKQINEQPWEIDVLRHLDWNTQKLLTKIVDCPYHVGQTIIGGQFFNGHVLQIIAINYSKGLLTVVDIETQDKAATDIKFSQVVGVATLYWFISSEGKIQRTYAGKNRGRDRWLHASGNYFETNEAATNYRDEILTRWHA